MDRLRPILTVCDDVGAVAGARIAAVLGQAVERRGRACLAVPGGRSPAPVFEWLAEHLPLEVQERLTVTFVDERHLPWSGDMSELPEQSNLALVWDLWLSGSPATVLPMLHPGEPDDAVSQFHADLTRLGGVDCALLGAGEDGHIASLFPGHPGFERVEDVFVVRDSPKPPPVRITLSRSVIEGAGLVLLVSTGSGKARMLSGALAGDDTPLGQLAPRNTWHWVLDRPAAAALEVG